MTATPTRTPRGGAVLAVRVLGAAQLTAGLLLSLRANEVAAAAAGRHGHAAPAWLVRILGLRSLAQGAVTIAAPTAGVLTAGALIDATHAVSMIPLIAFSARYRRAAAISACLAAFSAATGAAAATRTLPTAAAA